MRRRSRWAACWITATLAWPVAATPSDASAFQPPAGSQRSAFDPVHSRFGFELRTRWGQRVEGTFPRHDGAVVTLPDGRLQVRILLDTRAVEVEDSERYTGVARGERFFDAQHHPSVEFVSEPHHEALVHDGGQLRGRLTMHGVSRMETFTIAPATCTRPGYGCDVVATGVVSRDDYGLDGWKLVLTDSVRFEMRVRLQDGDE